MAVKSKKGKLSLRERKKLRIRKKVVGAENRPRLSVFRSTKHTYAQVISDVSGATLAQACTLEPEVAEQAKALAKKLAETQKEGEATGKATSSTKSVLAANAVGLILAKRCKEKGIAAVVFDRNGFLFHGRVKAVAEGAREGGLGF